MAIDKIEIRGLAEAVQRARLGISSIREEVAGLQDDSRRLQKALIEVRAQINQVHSDLKFEAENLGNSGQEIMPEESPSHQPEPVSDVAQTTNGPLPTYIATDHGNDHLAARRG